MGFRDINFSCRKVCYLVSLPTPGGPRSMRSRGGDVEVDSLPSEESDAELTSGGEGEAEDNDSEESD